MKFKAFTKIGIKKEEQKKKKKPQSMRNITINIPECYDNNIQKLISMKILPSRSEAIRTAVREFLHNEYNNNLKLLGYFDDKQDNKKFPGQELQFTKK